MGEYVHCEVMDVPDAAFAALLGLRIPQSKWNRSRPLDMNDTVRQLVYARNPVARFAYRFLSRKVNKAIAAGKPDSNSK